jgi:hypothetical protein
LISEPAQLEPSGVRHPAGSSSKPLLLRLLAGLALILYSLLFAETFVRVFDPQALMPRYVTGMPWGVRGNIPNARYRHHTPEVDVEYRINTQGLRADRDYPFAKPPGTCRIAIFGDSFFFGLEADLKDTFGDRLEKRLQARGVRVEVLNFSVGGFGTAEMLQTYDEFGSKFDPDVVIFSWDGSDLTDNVRSDLYRLDKGRLERTHATYLPAVGLQDSLMRYRLYRFINDHSELYTFLRERITRALKRRIVSGQKEQEAAAESGEMDNGAPTGGYDVDELQHRYEIDLSAAILAHARGQVMAAGRDFYLVDIPARRSRTEFSSSMSFLPPSIPAEINVVAPLPALSSAASPERKLYYEKGQGHFTPAGTEILVDETVKALASSHRLAACARAAPP